VDVIPASQCGLGFQWLGDSGTASALATVAAGKTVRMEVWNNDGTKRASGGVVVGYLI
jgi:hypothetical protein